MGAVVKSILTGDFSPFLSCPLDELHGCSGDHLCLLETQISQFLCPVVQTGSQQWSLGLGMLLGECEPGQIKLKTRSFWGNAAKDGWDRIKFSECWFQVTQKRSLKILFPPSPCFPIYWKLMAKDKSANCRRLEGYKRTEPGKIYFLWIKEKY